MPVIQSTLLLEAIDDGRSAWHVLTVYLDLDPARRGSPWRAFGEMVRDAQAWSEELVRRDLVRDAGVVQAWLESTSPHGPGPTVVDVPVDYGENARLSARLGQLVCPI